MHTVRIAIMKPIATILILVCIVIFFLYPSGKIGALIIILLPFLFIKDDYQTGFGSLLARKAIGGYAMTTLNLKELDPDLSVSKSLPLSDIDHFSEGTYWINIVPKKKNKLERLEY